ncbi:cytochrome P450 [Nocardioides zeae]|uniref:Cytochrome P450 n=1 Tax=Nocardioides imazamoxiresistens TaxID=3231893 RepID=A0ABU3PSD4_9ACTN|nr:cytochrome P450 [Nocardioides zeae]MDT9592149.1 cytochrome P450 [Nocardioides zeae]
MSVDQIALEDLRAQHRRDYDPYNNATIAEHLAEMAQRRREMPISYSARGNGTWVLTRYDDIASVLRRNNRGFVSNPNDPDGGNPQGAQKALIPIELDGDEHKFYRRLLDPLFSPQRVAALEDQLRAAANDFIDGFIERGECDFVEEFAMPFPGATVMHLMGWPLKDLGRLNEWTGTIQHGIVGVSKEESQAAQGRAATEMRAYLLDLIAERRTNLGDDVTSHVLRAEKDGAPLSDDDLFDLLLLLVLAGLDTVQSTFAQSFMHLGRQPELWDQMFASPESLEPAIEELLRIAAPAVPTRTVVHESVQVGELELPEGERVHFPLAAANRDPAYYPDPDRIVFDRAPKPHLAFGMGPHRCLGVHLARLELRIGFTELRRRMPRFSLDESRTPTEHLGLAWGVGNLHLLFEPGPRERS